MIARAIWIGTGAVLLLLASCSDEASDGDSPPSAGSSAGGGGTSTDAAGAASAGRGASGSGGSSAGSGGASGAAGRGGAPSAGGAAAGRSAEAGANGAGQGGSAGGAGTGGPVLENPCPGGPYGDPLPAPGARMATLIENGFDFLEGPVWIADQGVLLFSDMHMGQAGGSWPPSTIVRFTPPDTFDSFVETTATNGLAITPDGKLIACTHDTQTLSLFDLETAQRTPLALTYQGKHFNSTNDVTVRSDGTIYFTDPDWQLGGRESETDMTGVYYVTPGGQPQLIDGALDNPNGIALSPDERTLYVGSRGNDIKAYPVNDDGSVGTGTVFASPGSSDGLAIDCAGNLYVTASGIRVYDPEGDDLGTISVPESPANAAFGGEDRKTLYITARTGLYSIQLNVPGYPY